MGYFAYLYAVEITSQDDALTTTTSVYWGDTGGSAYFSWIPGHRSTKMFSYAGGTIFCDTKLIPLPGYPVKSEHRDSDMLVSTSFEPLYPEYPVLTHFVLPQGYVPDKTREPFSQPGFPTVQLQRDRVVATFTSRGRTEVRYWIRPLVPGEKMADFLIESLFARRIERPAKVKFEINLGVLKLSIGG